MANPKVTFDFKADISQINQAIQKIDQRLDKFGGKAKQHTEGFAGGMAKFGLAVSGVQQAFGILDQTIGAVARKVTELGGNFEHTMNMVKAVSGASGENFERLRDSALEFGSSTAKSASEVGKLQFELSKLGFKTDEILEGTEGILNMAIAFDVDLARSAEVAGGVLRQFGIDASEAGNVADIMATAFSSTALDTEKFANAMVYVGQIAPQAGFEVHEVTALLGVLSNKMVDSSIAGTALTKIMEQMANPDSDLAKEIGHTVTGYEGFVEVMQHMKTSGKDLTDFLGFVLPRTAKTFGVLVDSADDIDKLTESLKDVKGASKEMSDIMLDDLLGANLLIDSAMEGLWIRISEQLTPAFMDLKNAQIEFIQDIDTEEIYSYALGFTAVGIAVAYYNRTALKAVASTKAVKVALATSGWGLAIVAIGSVVGALIDATNAFESDTEAIDENTEAMDKNIAKAELLNAERLEITSISDIKTLEELKKKKREMMQDLKGESKLVTQMRNKMKTHLEYVVTQERTIFKSQEGYWKMKKNGWAILLNDMDKSIKYNKEGIEKIKHYEKIGQSIYKTDEARQKAIDKLTNKITRQIALKQLMIELEGLSYDQVMKRLNGLRDEQSTTKETVEMIDLQIEALEMKLKLEKDSNQAVGLTTEEYEKQLNSIGKIESRLREKLERQAEKMADDTATMDKNKYEKKRFYLDKEESEAKVEHAIFTQIINDKMRLIDEQTDKMTQGKEKDAKIAEWKALQAELLVHENKMTDINDYFILQRRKIAEDEKAEAEDLMMEQQAKALEMGFVMEGMYEREFSAHIEFLDDKILAEEAYTEKWFDLMEHRQSAYDTHIAHQLETGRMSTVEHLAMIQEQHSQEDLSTERKIELQGQMIEASKAFMEEGGMIHKSYLKKELVEFITAQQVKLLGKLAEIMATGASTLGVSLAVQLPIYAGAIAVLESAKSKVMAFEKGGLIDKPTMALMGEAGPEIVIPEQGFKDYVKEQIIPFQAQALGVPLSEFTNQNFISNSVNMSKQEQLTQINTSAIQKMSGEIGMLTKTMNQPQGVTITDGSTIINAEMERGRLN